MLYVRAYHGDHDIGYECCYDLLYLSPRLGCGHRDILHLLMYDIPMLLQVWLYPCVIDFRAAVESREETPEDEDEFEDLVVLKPGGREQCMSMSMSRSMAWA